MPETIPSSIGAEVALIGSVLLAPESLATLTVQEDDFFGLENRQVFQAIRTVSTDSVLVAAHLVRIGVFKSATDIGIYISSVPSPANVLEYEAAVKQAARSRRLMGVGADIVNRATIEDPTEVAEHAAAALREINVSSSAMEPVTMKQALLEYCSEKSTAPHPIGGDDYGLPELGKAIGGGLHWGGIMLVGGEAKNGKTCLALDLLRSAMRFGTPAYVVSRDQLYSHIAGRLWSGESGVPRDKLKSSDDALEIRHLMEGWPIYFHRAAFDVNAVCAYIRIAAATKGVKIWVVDYLQRLSIASSRSLRTGEGTVAIADALSDLAQDTNTTGIVISRVTKPSPGMSTQHRFSGEAGVQNSCDGMIYVHRMEEANEALRDEFYPDSIRLIEVLAGRYCGDSSVIVKLEGEKDRFKEKAQWSMLQRESWLRYTGKSRP
uniref:DNA 5'-3' helicase n=1 Tax=viral metagenome TaxID=1070528 RepID=A0A6M3LYR7_9ZZZZ